MAESRDSSLDVCVVGFARTAMGAYRGGLSGLSAPELGAVAIREAVARSRVGGEHVEEVFMGHVLQAGAGQAPARQAALRAGLPDSVPCTAINKVCSSGMKAIMVGALSIKAGLRDVVVVGGMESMSRAPFLADKKGGAADVAVMARDGLTDSCGSILPGTAMGMSAELCCDEEGITREDMDAHAAESYRRAVEASAAGKFAEEIVPVPAASAAMSVDRDEEAAKRGALSVEALGKLRPAFKKDAGRVTAGNSSTVSDGAAALVLASRAVAEARGLPIRAVLRGMGDAAQASERFTTAPALAVPRALAGAGDGVRGGGSGLRKEDVDLWEINEAFSAVAIANVRRLQLDPAKVNVYGGAVALGHPIGASGARIVCTLIRALEQERKTVGCAAVCNGGGGASAVVVAVPPPSGEGGSSRSRL